MGGGDPGHGVGRGPVLQRDPLDFEVVAAEVSGDLAYLVGYERSAFSVDGGPVEATSLRVTHIYRREEGAWKLVHRHGDPGPGGNPAVGRFQANPGRPPQAPH
jgi:ketosteroid isomerase-like protein